MIEDALGKMLAPATAVLSEPLQGTVVEPLIEQLRGQVVELWQDFAGHRLLAAGQAQRHPPVEAAAACLG